MARFRLAPLKKKRAPTLRDEWDSVKPVPKTSPRLVDGKTEAERVTTRRSREQEARGIKPHEFPRFFFYFHIRHPRRKRREIVPAMAYSTKRAEQQAARYAAIFGASVIKVV